MNLWLLSKINYDYRHYPICFIIDCGLQTMGTNPEREDFEKRDD